MRIEGHNTYFAIEGGHLISVTVATIIALQILLTPYHYCLVLLKKLDTHFNGHGDHGVAIYFFSLRPGPLPFSGMNSIPASVKARSMA